MMSQEIQQHTGEFCKVFFHYVPSLDFTEQFLTHIITGQVAKSYTPVNIAREVEKIFSGENRSFWTEIKLQDEVGFHELERLLLAKWFEFKKDAENAAWLEFLPMERRMYQISYNTKVSFKGVSMYGGALVSSNQFVSHWDTTPSNDGLLFPSTTFDYNKELIEIKRQESVQISFTQIEERIVFDHHKLSWYIYLGLKKVPKVYTDYNQLPKRALSIQQIDKKDFGNTSVICLNIPEKPYGESKLEIKQDIQTLLTMLRQFGFKLAFATIKEKRPREEDLARTLPFRTFELEYGWQCLLSCGFKVTDSLTSESIPILRKHRSALTPDVFQLMASKAENNQFFDFNTSFMECLQEVKSSWKTDDDETKEPHLTMCRRLVVTPSREIPMAKEPIVPNRVIRQYKHDYFIRVVFRDEDFTKLSGDGLTILSDRIRDFMDKGFTIGNRHYEFLACSNSQLRDHGVWFFSPYEGWTSEKIRNSIGDFKEERCVATYVSRMGLCFSATKDTFEVDDKNVAFIEDIKHESYCFTDGIGKISLSLAKKVAKTLKLDRVPSAFQIRYGGCKGVVALDPTLGDSNDILYISTSMKKFDSPSKHLEILDTTRPAQLYLNRQVITLMSGLGVPDHVFLDLQETMIFEMAEMLLYDNKAMKALNEVNLGIKYVDLRNAGVSFTTNVFFRSVLLTIYKNKLRELTRKARIEIPIEKGRIMMGTVDETGILEYGQVFVSYTKIGEVSSRDVDILKTEVVVTKNPCFHPGDLRKFQAVDVLELHHLVDCIVFPQNGPRPHPDEMSGSDLDGDKYFVC
ncbi:uncharacterized protein [Argopecten irradians]|uniref:uncharacterized protein n=1 Tax=Argopecten irradians TaxID=31199 RepID=UPI0037216D99